MQQLDDISERVMPEKDNCLANIRIAVLAEKIIYSPPASLFRKTFAPCDSNQYQENSRAGSTGPLNNAVRMLLRKYEQVKLVTVKLLNLGGMSVGVDEGVFSLAEFVKDQIVKAC